MLRLLGAKQQGARDTALVLRVLDSDPVASCMVAARIQDGGMDPRVIQGEVWSRGGPRESLCFSGANLVPLRGAVDDLRAFADRALRARRVCSSLVGRSELVLPLWGFLQLEWGQAREVREEQPLLALVDQLLVPPDPEVRLVRMSELEPYLEAAIAMFIDEVGVDPRSSDGGRGYRNRVSNLIACGRAWARFEGGEVIFKAEIGALSHRVGQIQGVWVHPQYRGKGLGSGGTSTVASWVIARGRTPSLYVNSYNIAARNAYAKVGFAQVATFATVLVD